ncbi:MAG: DUF1499 domain-containing protein [Halioglobus sp.]|nr:DUF1499 domain-containing protein [Halioglobus sp.]
MTLTRKMPGLINWIGYLAITLLLALPLAVLTVRAGAWQQGLMIYAAACLGAALLLLLAVVLMWLPRFAHWRRELLGRALIALPGTVLLLSVLTGRGDYPPIHDITTDTDDVPVFVAAPAQREAASNTLEVVPATIAVQRATLPDIQTLRTQLPIDEAFDRAAQVAADMGWDIYHRDRDAGTIEALATTPIMGFRDDVVVRVRSDARGTLVDLRSVSRVGVGDMGANARRILAFQDAFRQRQ